MAMLVKYLQIYVDYFRDSAVSVLIEITKIGRFTRPNNNVRDDKRYDGEDDNGDNGAR